MNYHQMRVVASVNTAVLKWCETNKKWIKRTPDHVWVASLIHDIRHLYAPKTGLDSIVVAVDRVARLKLLKPVAIDSTLRQPQIQQDRIKRYINLIEKIKTEYRNISHKPIN